MIADINITEKSFGPKQLMGGVRFSIDNGEKVGVIGRNGVGKSTLFGILTGQDNDYTGDVIYHRGVTVVSTSQEHHNLGDISVLQYILSGLPEYAELSHIIETYPTTMGDSMKKISEYSSALDRFNNKGFYHIEEKIERELETFQLINISHRPMKDLSGGQKRMVEIVKVMHSDADLALIDEPTNHMDYVAKSQYIDWMKSAREAMLVITHDREVLSQVDRIIEIKDGKSFSFKGSYDDYLKQNTAATSVQMNDFETVEKRKANLKNKIINYQRLKEKSRDPGTIKNFKRLEESARKELSDLRGIEKPTFWVDKESVIDLSYKTAAQYHKFKAKNIHLNIKSDESRSKKALVTVRNLSLGYGAPLFNDINMELHEGEAVELRGRNGVGKTTFIKALLNESGPTLFSGEISIDKNVRIGIYEQEVSADYFDISLEEAIERIYLDRNLAISTTKIRSLMNDYLFTENDRMIKIARLSGGQKARLQLIKMLAGDPQLLILDEPTNHLDLPSIEELESALSNYSGAILYVSHDAYFQRAIGGDVLMIEQKSVQK